MPSPLTPTGMAPTYTVGVDPITGAALSADVNSDTAALITHSAAGAGTVNGADQTNATLRGLKLVIDITALTGTPTLTVTVQGKDAASGKYYTILASAALAAVATTVLTVYPGMVAAANVTANDVLPKTWRVITVIGGGTPVVTATVGASLIN